MKKHILVFALLIALLIPGEINEVGSGDMICGYVYPYTYTDWGCIVGWPMDTCDGQRVYLWNPPDYYIGHWIILFDPVWAERCVTCKDGSTKCGQAITTCSGAQYIRSCEDCGFPESQPDPCKNVVCSPRCLGPDDCDYWATKCVNGECVEDYIIERDSKNCGCGDPCRNVVCDPQCLGPDGCDYWDMGCVDGTCEKLYLIEEDSEKCGCGKKDEESNEVENARRELYENYAEALDGWYWTNRGTEMLTMFGEDFISSFTTPIGILKSTAKEAAIGKYTNAELVTKQVTTLVGTLKYWDMGCVLGWAYSHTEGSDPSARMRDISNLIDSRKFSEAEREIRELCSYLQNAYQNVDEVTKCDLPGNEETKKAVKSIIAGTIGFLEAECEEHFGSTCQCVAPEVTPESTPESEAGSGPCLGTSLILLMILSGVAVNRVE